MILPLVTNDDVSISSDDNGHVANDSSAPSSKDASNCLFVLIEKSKLKRMEKMKSARRNKDDV